MKQRLGIALLLVLVLAVVGFQSRAEATEYDSSERLAQVSKLLKTKTGDWERTSVDPDGSWGVSLALDSADIPHISYYAHEEYGQTPATWKYATQRDGTWSTEQVVDPSAFRAANVYSSSLILDSSNSPHVAFGLFGANSSSPYPMLITHAFKQAETWEFEEVEVIEDTCGGPYVTLLSDSSGGLHLFYAVYIKDVSECRSVLKYARQLGTNSWQISTLVEGNVSAPSVMIDRDDNFHLAYVSYGETLYSLQYSKFNSVAQFSPATIFTSQPETYVRSASIALDSSSVPYVAFVYYRPRNGYWLYVAHQGATEWIIEDSGKRLGSSSDINPFVDTQDNLHVYAGNTYGFNTVVEHYYKTQDGWQAEEIGAPASDISFVLDSSENVHGAAVHFSYGTASSWSLWYHRKLGDALAYTISGRVTTQSGTPLPGMVVSTAVGSSTTDADGNYTITDLPAGTYDISPTLPGYSFAPSMRSVSVPPDATSQDFVGIPDATTDSDGDGLLDDWEINGYDHDNDGIVDVDLFAMGAALFKPDIFVEVDWMEGHKPEDEAIRRIVDSFANAPVYDEAGNQIGTGINLHVDVGPDSTDYVTGELWGDNGEGNSVGGIDETIVLPDNEDLSPINPIITNEINRSEARKHVFHYSLWISWLKYKEYFPSGYSAAEKHGEPIFVVALGGGANGIGSVSEQAGTFMHELGHNLGLDHSGGQGNSVHYKPNYLSVMNYSFQHGGLIINGVDGCDECFDYSRFELPPLDEAELYENVGLNGGDEANPYGTKFRRNPPWLCWPYEKQSEVYYSLVLENANSNVNWNCDQSINQDPVQEDVNGDEGDAQVLTGYNDWLNLDFNYAHRDLRPQLGAQTRHLRSNNIGGIDQSLGFEELSFEEDRLIPRISETRAQITASAHPNFVAPLDTLTYTVTVHTVDMGTIHSFVPTVSLPDGFSYIPNSTSGYISANPVISGNQLTWPSIEIPDATTPREFSFQVRVGTTEGVFSTDFRGTSSTGLVIPDQVEVHVQREPLEGLFLPMIVR